MTRLKSTTSLFAVAIFFVAGAATDAQAHNYRVNGAALGAGVKKALKNNSELVLTQELLGAPFAVATHINCKHLETTGEIEGTTAGKALLEFSSCTVTKPANCVVQSITPPKVVTALIGPEPGVELLISPEVGTRFTTITLTDLKPEPPEPKLCSLTGFPFEVTGTQICKLPGGENESKRHEIACEPGGSSLKAGGKNATFKGGIKELELQGLEEWSAV